MHSIALECGVFPMVPVRKRVLAFTLFTFALLFSGAPHALAQQGTRPKAASAAGRNLYNSSCAGCHGLDGHGSDKAVNIGAGSEVQHLSDSQISGIISNGVPGTGMPAFHTLTTPQVRALVSYVRSLQGRTQAQSLPGDAKRGQAIFFGKGECASCHTVSGQGGFLGPDLSNYASTSSAKGIREEIVRPRRTPPLGYRSAVLTTAEGQRIEGLVRNEDNFSVQFQAKDGSFHLFDKSKLRSIEPADGSLMPTNYGERLSSAELDDLVSFLISASPDGKAGTSRKKESYEDE